MSFKLPRASRSVVFAPALLLAACTIGSLTAPGEAATVLEANGRGQALMEPADASQFPRDPLAVKSARIAGDSLIVMVSHGGGCARHTYTLLVSRVWMESLPVQVGARLSHDANGDPCKALLQSELHFSLAPLSAAYVRLYGQRHATISIPLSGWPDNLFYTF